MRGARQPVEAVGAPWASGASALFFLWFGCWRRRWGGGVSSAYGPRSNVFHTGCVVGSGNSTAGVLPIAVSMNSRQIVAGKLPPETAIPCTFCIGISPCG